ncbi:MAG: hypothetical protein II328_00290 [Clostridia bacterium]|nr:hypothetical protein [Clostridia bacterium]
MEDFYDKTADGAQATEAQGEAKETVSVAVPKTMAYSVVCLVLSLMSVVCCCSGFISLLFAAAAIVFAIVSRKHLGYFDTMSIVGLVVAIVGAVFSLFVIGVWILSLVGGFDFGYGGFPIDDSHLSF